MSIATFLKRIRDIMRQDKGVDGDAQRLSQIVWLLFLMNFDHIEEEKELDVDNYQPVIPEGYRWRDWAKPENIKDELTGEALIDFVNNELFPVLRGDAIEKDGEKIVIFSRNDDIANLVKAVMRDAFNYMKDGILLRQVINVVAEVNLANANDAHEFNRVYEEMLAGLQSAGSAGEFYTNRAITKFAIEKIDPRVGMTLADFAAGTGGFLVDGINYQMKQVKTTEEREIVLSSIKACEFKPLPYQLLITNLLLHGVEMPDVYYGSALEKRLSDYTAKDCVDRIAMNPPYGGVALNSEKMNFPADMRSAETFDLFIQLIIKRLAINGKAVVVLPDGFLFGTDNVKVNIKKKLMNECNLHTIIRLPQSCFAPYTGIATNLLFFDKTGATDKVWFYRLDMPEGIKHFSKTRPMKREHFAPVDEWWNDRREILDIKSHEDASDTWKSKCYSYDEIEKNNFNLDLCGYPVEEKIILSPRDTIQNFIEKRNSLDKEMDEMLDEILAVLEVE